MRFRLASGEVLVLSGGAPSDETPRVFAAPAGATLDPREARVVLALVEPIESGLSVDNLAEQIICMLLDHVDGAPSDQASARVCEAYDRANEYVRTANHRRGGARRTFLGLTCMVVAGNNLLVAHVAPGQVLVWQEGKVFAFPEVDDSNVQTPRVDAPFARPLGLHRQTEPALMTSLLSPNDLVVAMSTTAAAAISSQLHAIRSLKNADALLTNIGAACDRSDVEEAVVGIVEVESARAPSRSGAHERTPRSGRNPQEGPSWARSALDLEQSRVQTEIAHTGSDSGGSISPVATGPSLNTSVGAACDQTEELPIAELGTAIRYQTRVRRAERSASADGASNQPAPHATLQVLPRRSVPATLLALHASALVERRTFLDAIDRPKILVSMNLLAGLLLSLVATVVGVWTVARRDRPLHGPRDDGTLGLPRLQRWDVSYRPPRMQRLRRSLPHLEAGRLIVVGVLFIILAAAAMYGFSRLRDHSAASAEEFEQHYQVILARHSDAKAEADVPTAYAILIDAKTRLEALAASLPAGSVDSRIEAERAALQSDLDRLTNITTMEDVNTVGSVPVAPVGIRPQLFSGGGRIFLLTDALYQVDVANASLVRLIGSGDTVGLDKVGTIRGGAWRGDRPIVVDEKDVWNLDPATGAWSAEALGTFDATGYVDVGAVDTFEQNLYMLTPESGKILKFQAGSYQGNPDDWANGVSSDDLSKVVDLSVDGHIWALTKDGRVLDLFRSRVESDLQPVYMPPLDSASAIVASAGSPYLYVLNSSDGRIVRLTRDGRIVQQFDAASAVASLDGAADLVVDDSTGIAFILANNTIYSVRLPAPPS